MVIRNLSTIFYRLLVLLAGLLISPSLATQEEQLYVNRIGSQQGLSANYVNCIYQDQEGFIWIGTFGGLNRYDGYEMEEYTPDSQQPGTISGIRVIAITGESSGNLWVGTAGNGLNYYDRSTNTFTVFEHDPEDPNSLSSNTVKQLVRDQQNRLWIGTDEGLCMLDLNNFTPGVVPKFTRFKLPNEPANAAIEGVFVDNAGQVWTTARQRVYRTVTADQAAFKRISVGTDENVQIEAFTQVASGEILLGGVSGLFKQVGVGTERFERVGKVSRISSLAYDPESDQLWVGTAIGLYKFAVGRNGEAPTYLNQYVYDPLNPSSLSGDDILTLYIDNSRVIWVGTSGGGLSTFDPMRKQFFHYKNATGGSSLSANTIRTVYQDSRGRVWVGKDGGGINLSQEKLEPRKEADFQSIATPSRVYSIMEVENSIEHSLYFGSSSGPGLFKLDMASSNLNIRPIREFDRSVFDLLEDSSGNIWLGTYSEGVYRWTPDPTAPTGYREVVIGGDQATGDKLPSKIIRSLAEDQQGNIWIGTGKGLTLLRKEDKHLDNPPLTTFKNLAGDPTSLSNDYILPLFVAKDGTLWIGTFGGGLNRYLPPNEGSGARFKVYGEREGLINGVVKGIMEDDQGHLWISSNNGISRFDPEKEVFDHYDVNDGLQGDEFGELATCQQDDGTFIFGGVNGLTVFNPQAIKANPILAQPAITGMSILNQPIKVGEAVNGEVILPVGFNQLEEIQLRYHQNSISLELAALHYAAPEKNRFAYKLEGFDPDWIYTTIDQRVATYTNLPPRDYTFKLKVSNNDEAWNEEALQLGIVIKPPFWQTIPMYLLYGLMFLGFLYLIRRYSIIDIKEKNRIELKKVNQEKTEELNQLKLQFFTNISHEFRTPLTLIAGPLENLISNQSSISPDQRNQYYHLMYKNSKYLLRLVNQLLDFRQLDQGKLSLQVHKDDIISFIEETVAPFEFLATKKNIDFSITFDERPITTWFAPDALEKILFNLLSNAFKFTPEGGSIELGISKTTADDQRFNTHLPGYGALLIRVKDSGPGIPRKQLKRIFDRFYKSTQAETQNREGAGIGLAFTKSLVDLHRGLINVESTVGKGTTFFLRFALDKSIYHKAEIATQIQESYIPHSDPVDYFMPEENNQEEDLNALQLRTNQLLKNDDKEESPILLYIDDNPDLRNYIRNSFANEFRVIAADGGAAGLELATTSSPDIIVCDVMMPEVDGLQVLEKVKSDPQTSHIPVVMLTANASEETRIKGLKYGADGYVTKPFNHDFLKQQILNIVQYRNLLRNRFRLEVITEPAEVTVTDSDEIFLRQAMDVVEENMSNTEFSVDQLVKEMGVSRSKLYLKLKALTGQSSSEFVRTVRLKRAVQLLEDSNYSVKEVMYMTGFNTASYFSKCFKRQFGIVPSEYVKHRKGKGDR